MTERGDERTDGPVAVGAGLLTPMEHGPDGTRVRWMQADGVRVEMLDAGPHRFSSRPDDGPERAAALVIIVVAGEVHGEVDGEHVVVRAGEAAFIDTAEAVDLVVETDIAMCRYVLDAAVLPQVWHGRPRPPLLLLETTPLVSACVGFAGGLLGAKGGTASDAEGALVAGAVLGIQSALLGEAWRQHDIRAVDAEGTPMLRRIVRHVDAHLMEPDLTPTRIAGDLGVHVRTIHSAFVDTDTSAAAFIRERRVSAASSYLWTQDRLPPLDVLAERFGVRGRDQLSRAFKAVTGRSVQQWWHDTKGGAGGVG